jgi:hypothetical protein
VHGADALMGVGLAGAGADLGTAAGAGLLVFVGGLRWAVRRWERAQRAWVADWRRMAAGAGLLVFVGGLRWAVRRWERAQRAWVADWRRMAAGAERDIKVRATAAAAGAMAAGWG